MKFPNVNFFNMVFENNKRWLEYVTTPLHPINPINSDWPNNIHLILIPFDIQQSIVFCGTKQPPVIIARPPCKRQLPPNQRFPLLSPLVYRSENNIQHPPEQSNAARYTCGASLGGYLQRKQKREIAFLDWIAGRGSFILENNSREANWAKNCGSWSVSHFDPPALKKWSQAEAEKEENDLGLRHLRPQWGSCYIRWRSSLCQTSFQISQFIKFWPKSLSRLLPSEASPGSRRNCLCLAGDPIYTEVSAFNHV